MFIVRVYHYLCYYFYSLQKWMEANGCLESGLTRTQKCKHSAVFWKMTSRHTLEVWVVCSKWVKQWKMLVSSLITEIYSIHHLSLSLRPVWNFAGHVGRLSQIMLSVHWSEHTTFLVSTVQHVNSKLESKLLLREKLEKCIASRTITGMRVKNDGMHHMKNTLYTIHQRFSHSHERVRMKQN